MIRSTVWNRSHSLALFRQLLFFANGHVNCVHFYGACSNPIGLAFELCPDGALQDALWIEASGDKATATFVAPEQKRSLPPSEVRPLDCFSLSRVLFSFACYCVCFTRRSRFHSRALILTSFVCRLHRTFLGNLQQQHGLHEMLAVSCRQLRCEDRRYRSHALLALRSWHN